MAIRLLSVKCPDCGAMLDVEESRKQMFCSYCGTKIIIENGNEHIYRHIDEAALKQAEIDRMVKLHEIEIDNKRIEQNNKVKSVLFKIWIWLSIILIVIGLAIMLFGGLLDGEEGLLYGVGFLFYLGAPIIIGGAILIFKVIPDKETDKAAIKNGWIKLPRSIFPYSEKNYIEIESMLKSVGFKNVTSVNIHDLTFGLFQKPGLVESISINGNKIISGGKAYAPDASIVISYHGK